MTRTCRLKCDACGRETHKHETLAALQTDTQGWHWHGDMHVCSDCQQPARADIAPAPLRPHAPSAVELSWDS